MPCEQVQTAFALLSGNSGELCSGLTFGSVLFAPDQVQLCEPVSIAPILRRALGPVASWLGLGLTQRYCGAKGGATGL